MRRNAAPLTFLVLALSSCCEAPQRASSEKPMTRAEAVAMEQGMLERCQGLLRELGPGWTIASHPCGVPIEAARYDRLEWHYTRQTVRLDCFESKKIATFVTGDGEGGFRASIVDLTGAATEEIEDATGEEGWDGGIATFNSDVAGTATEQRLHLFLLIGERDGERRVIAREWCQIWRACPQRE